MEPSWKPSMERAVSRTRDAWRLWFAGFADACCLHRVVSFCLKSKKLSIRTGQCFLLNGFIFLGWQLRWVSVDSGFVP